MNEIYILRGFSVEEIERAKDTLSSGGENLSDLGFFRATRDMMEEKVEPLLNRLEQNPEPVGELLEGSRTVIMATGSQEKALTVMRAFKSVLENPSEAAFAMVTQTSLNWTLGYYMEHVNKEHEYMKTHNPAEDPDMKKIN